MIVQSWPLHYESEKLLSLAHQQRAINVHDRKWSYCKSGEETFALLPNSFPRYLYRGQVKRYTPCFPSMYRHFEAPARLLRNLPAAEAIKIVADIARTFWCYSEFDNHPIFRWAKSKRLQLPYLQLAQHYGLATPLLDLSESIEVALFFATHRLVDGEFQPCTTGKGILYIIDRMTMSAEFAPRFAPVSIQPFPRPFRQWAWACELLMGECFEAYPGLGAIEFDHCETMAKEIRSMAEAAGSLFPPDHLATISAHVNAADSLPEASIEAAMKHLGEAFPSEVFGSIHDALRSAGYTVVSGVSPIVSGALLEDLDRQHASRIAEWEQSISQEYEHLVVAGGGDSGKPLKFSALTPQGPIDRTDRYFSLFDPATSAREQT